MYSALVFVPISVTVRERGEFNRKTAVVVVAAQPERTPELLGLWVAPRPRRGAGAAAGSLVDQVMEAKTALDNFWHNLIADLAGRGAQRVPVFCRDIPSQGYEFPNAFYGFDEAVLGTYPNAAIVPRANGIGESVVPILELRMKDWPALPEDVADVIRAPSADEALSRLERLDQRWNQKYPHVSQQLREAWQPLMQFVALPEATRKLLLDADDGFEATRKSVEKALRERGAFSDDFEALGFLQGRCKRHDRYTRHQIRWQRFRHRDFT